jgi:hypothetical protein
MERNGTTFILYINPITDRNIKNVQDYKNRPIYLGKSYLASNKNDTV